MPSEKLRYLVARAGPKTPLEFQELRAALVLMDPGHLVDMILNRAQSDALLRKTAILSVVFRSTAKKWELSKAAIDHALYFPDYIRYHERGHGQILREIESAVLWLTNQEQREYAMRIAEYSIKHAAQIADNFEDGWEWSEALANLKGSFERLRDMS